MPKIWFFISSSFERKTILNTYKDQQILPYHFYQHLPTIFCNPHHMRFLANKKQKNKRFWTEYNSKKEL